MSLRIYMLPVSARGRAAFNDLRGSGVRATDACDLIATLETFRSMRARLNATCTIFARYGMTAASAHSWLLARYSEPQNTTRRERKPCGPVVIERSVP